MLELLLKLEGLTLADWIKRMIEYGFDEDVDYLVTDIFAPNSNGGKQTQIEYAITLDMAKEIAMIQRTEKGKQARKYFIEAKKKVQPFPDHTSFPISLRISSQSNIFFRFVSKGYSTKASIKGCC